MKNKPVQVILEKGRGLARGQKILTRCREQGDRAFFFPPASREENTRALTLGDSLRVMNMIIGQGTVSLCDSEPAIGATGRGEREKRVGKGEERRREGEERRKERRREESRRDEERRGGKARRGAERRGVERSGAAAGGPGGALLRRSAFPAAMVYYFRALPQLRAALHNKIYFKTQLKETGRLHVTV